MQQKTMHHEGRLLAPLREVLREGCLMLRIEPVEVFRDTRANCDQRFTKGNVSFPDRVL